MRVSLVNVGYRYPSAMDPDPAPDALPALADVSLTLEAGRCTVLLGHSGAGKSTLLQLVANILTPTTGQVELQREPGDAPRGIAVGLVLQQPERHFFRSTVLDEVAIGVRWAAQRKHCWPRRAAQPPDPAVEQRIHGALAAMGLPVAEFGERHPRTLSGGEQRRLALACSLALEPAFLALDEPLAGLDGWGRQAVRETVRRLCADGKGVLLTAHALDALLPVTHRVVALHQGRVALDLALDDLLAAPHRLREAGLEPWPLAQAGELLQQRGRPRPDPSSPEAFAAFLLRHRAPASTRA